MSRSSCRLGPRAQFSPPPKACGTIITGLPRDATLSSAPATEAASPFGIGYGSTIITSSISR